MKELQHPFDGNLLLRKRKVLLKKLNRPKEQKRIAILGGSTTAAIKEMIELFLIHEGISPIFYESDFGHYWSDVMFDSKLVNFSPDIIFIHTTFRNITTHPHLKDSVRVIEEKLESQFLHFQSMWEKLREVYRCPIIQNNFERPLWRLMGNRDIWDNRGCSNFVSRLNQKMYEYAQRNNDFYINDIDYLASHYGLEKWHDSNYWHMYKYALSLSAVPDLAFSVSNIIKSIYGKNKKALVLDLDDTLWGGVIGDDGCDGITLGSEVALGQAFLEFQQYIKAHKDLGIILNIASKNDLSNAIAGLNHPNSMFSPDDFAVIEANWENKDFSIRKIASVLNIGLDSLVFVDDNPLERAIVKEFNSEVAVLEASKVEDFIRVLDGSGFFETTLFTEEDSNKTMMYTQNTKRTNEEKSYDNYQSFLKSLQMRGVIKCFEPYCLKRITQLINKTNQFNLTTKRYCESEIEAIVNSSDYVTLYGTLSDRFGDNGLVSAIIGRKNADRLDIDLWVMSCRVLKREMELVMLDYLVKETQKKGLRQIKGFYYPTHKNALVKTHYENLGFNKIMEDQDGNSEWILNLENYQEKIRLFEIEET